MADQFSRMYDVERVGGDQRQRLAEMLRANALNAPQGQMVSGWYVPPSWSQNLAHLAQTATGVLGGQYMEEQKNKQFADLLKKYGEGAPIQQEQPMQNINRIESMGEGQTQQEPQNELQRIIQSQRQIQSPDQSQITQARAPAQPQQYRPWTAQEKENMLMQAYEIDPRRAAALAARYDRDVSREEARALKEEQRAWQSRENQLNRENQQLGWMIARGNRPERNITIMGEDFQPITMPQSQVPVGTPLYTPAAAKAAKERQGQIEGKANVGEQIQGLREQYNVLNQNMAIPSEQNRWGSNLGAKLSSTGVGQWLGQVGGTQSATARDVIRMSRPGLMQSIVKASGMSAKQIDSNAELKLMLDQATDPTAGYEANMKALDNLDKRFGLSPQSQQNQTSSKW